MFAVAATERLSSVKHTKEAKRGNSYPDSPAVSIEELSEFHPPPQYAPHHFVGGFDLYEMSL